MFHYLKDYLFLMGDFGFAIPWITLPQGNYAVEKTVRDYSRQILKFVGAVRAENSGFYARHWMAYNSQNFMPLANVCIFVCFARPFHSSLTKLSSYSVDLSWFSCDTLISGRGMDWERHQECLSRSDDKRLQTTHQYGKKWFGQSWHEIPGVLRKNCPPRRMQKGRKCFGKRLQIITVGLKSLHTLCLFFRCKTAFFQRVWQKVKRFPCLNGPFFRVFKFDWKKAVSHLKEAKGVQWLEPHCQICESIRRSRPYSVLHQRRWLEKSNKALPKIHCKSQSIGALQRYS